MRNLKFGLHFTAILGITGSCLYVMQNCGITQKKQPNSNLSDIATSGSLKTGMFMPISGVGNEFGAAASKRITSSEKLAALLSIKLKKGDTYRTTTTAEGENILLVERVGMLPVPIASLDASGQRYAWSFYSQKLKNGNIINSNLYVRHEYGTDPVGWVSNDGQKSNMFFMRKAYSQKGELEPLLVSYLNHLISKDIVLYRVGNTVLDTERNSPILGFRPLGNQVWEMTGVYRDEDLSPGSIFWSKDLKTFYSLSPKSRMLTEWLKQDKDSMDRVGRPVEGSVQIPAMVIETLSYREKLGYGNPDKFTPMSGPSMLELDAGTIPVYANDAMYAQRVVKKSASFGLAGSDDFYADPRITSLIKMGAVEKSSGGFSLGGEQLRPGSTVSFTNWNNGAVFSKVHVVTNESHLVPRSALSSLWNNKSDYQGYKITGEILDRDGKPTGQYIEQTINSEAGVYEQRMLSRSEITREAQATLDRRDVDMRLQNAKIAEAQKLADETGARADAAKAELDKRIQELPGKVASAVIVGGVSEAVGADKLPSGANGQVASWVAQGAGKEALSQGINAGVGTGTLDGAAVVASGMSSLIGKSSVDGLVDGLGKNVTKEVIGSLTKEATKNALGGGSEVLTNVNDPNGGKSPISPGAVITDKATLAVADFAVDSAFSAAGSAVGGPIGKSIAAGGAEIAKVGNAEVQALGLSSKEILERSQVNAEQTTALNIGSNARSSKSLLDYAKCSNPGGMKLVDEDCGDSEQQESVPQEQNTVAGEG